MLRTETYCRGKFFRSAEMVITGAVAADAIAVHAILVADPCHMTDAMLQIVVASHAVVAAMVLFCLCLCHCRVQRDQHAEQEHASQQAKLLR